MHSLHIVYIYMRVCIYIYIYIYIYMWFIFTNMFVCASSMCMMCVCVFDIYVCVWMRVRMCVRMRVCEFQSLREYECVRVESVWKRVRERERHWATKNTYGVATISRLLRITGPFCKRTLEKRLYSVKETYNFKEPTIRSHPICIHICACVCVCEFRSVREYLRVYFNPIHFSQVQGGEDS